MLDQFKAGKVDDELSVCTNVESLLSEVKDWSLNWLKMNDTKTEFIYFGFPKQLEKTVVSEMSVGDSVVQRSNSIKLLGFILDSSLNCKDHIKSKCGIVNVCNRHRIRKISRFLSLESGKILASALVLAHFDYGNSLFAGLPNSSLRPMQLIQNFSAKVLTRRRRFVSATMALMELQRLLVRERCKFKIMLMTYKALNNLSPKYLSELLSYTSPVYKSRSSNDDLLLNIPFTRRSTFTDLVLLAWRLNFGILYQTQ